MKLNWENVKGVRRNICEGVDMRYQPQDFARCAGNPCFEYCKDCLRSNAPVHPDSTRSVWIGVWVMEDEKCPSFVGKKEE